MSVRGMLAAVLLFLIGWGGYEWNGTLKAHALLDGLLRADTTKCRPSLRTWLLIVVGSTLCCMTPRPRRRRTTTVRKQLHTSLALLPVDASQVKYLYGRLLDAEPGEVPVIRDALAAHQEELVDKLWAVVEAPEKGKESQRLRAAAALAKYDPQGERWGKVQEAVGNDLVGVPAVYLALWMDSLRPVRAKLLAPLSAVYRETGRRDVERSLATDILADYAADQPQVLADLLMDADEQAVRRDLPEVQGAGRARPARADRRDRQETPARPAILG